MSTVNPWYAITLGFAAAVCLLFGAGYTVDDSDNKPTLVPALVGFMLAVACIIGAIVAR